MILILATVFLRCPIGLIGHRTDMEADAPDADFFLSMLEMK